VRRAGRVLLGLRLLRRGPRMERLEQQLRHLAPGAVMRRAAVVLAAACASLSLPAAGCGTELGPDPGLEALAVTRVAPHTIIPGTRIVVKGASFVDEQWGAATLRLVGQAGGRDVDVSWPATFVDFGTMTVAVDAGAITAL